MNTKLIKGIGIAASVIGAVATVAGNWATNKETDNKIAENVTKAVAEALKKEAKHWASFSFSKGNKQKGEFISKWTNKK